MIEHHIQKQIITDLVECEFARYADLKPSNIEGNVFTYHLKNLITQKYIMKNDDGAYCLTNKGKLYGINSSIKSKDLLEQAHSIILLYIRNKDRWLLRKRLVQPMHGKIGFIHGEPISEETIEETGKRILLTRTGLEGDMTVKGSGYIMIQDDISMIAYSNFTLLEVNNLKGEMIKLDSHGENMWLENPDFNSSEMIPSMPDLVSAINSTGLFFMDKKYTV